METLSTTDVRTLLGIITEDEFARAVGVVADTVTTWRTSGEGPPFFRFRRNIFYRTADVIQWMIENTVDTRTNEYMMPRPAPLPPRPKRAFPKRQQSASPEGDATRAAAARPEGAQQTKSTHQPEERGGAVEDHVASVLPRAS